MNLMHCATCQQEENRLAGRLSRRPGCGFSGYRAPPIRFMQRRQQARMATSQIHSIIRRLENLIFSLKRQEARKPESQISFVRVHANPSHLLAPNKNGTPCSVGLFLLPSTYSGQAVGELCGAPVPSQHGIAAIRHDQTIAGRYPNIIQTDCQTKNGSFGRNAK